MRAHKLLWLEDDLSLVESMTALIRDQGLQIDVVNSVAAATKALRASGSAYHAVLLDLHVSDGTALPLLELTCEMGVPTAILTGYASVDSAIEAFRLGAMDVLRKPISDVELIAWLQQLELPGMPEVAPQPEADEILIGSSAGMRQVLGLVDAVAGTPVCVLLSGESGTGKSLVAREIARRSQRRDGPFVEVCCGALTDSLLESELFGHARGSFTGAEYDYAGKIAAADGGTIFLDEIGTASSRLQLKLLRFLQDRTYQPVGSNDTVRSTARVVLATNEDLRSRVAEGSFREDLYYRINVINIAMPPLRDRATDLDELADYLLAVANNTLDKDIRGYTEDARAVLASHPWPGNIRELKNVIERAVLLSSYDMITPGDLLLDSPRASLQPPTLQAGMSLKEALAIPEREFIEEALATARGNRSVAANRLGINRATLYKKMKRLGLLSSKAG